MGKVVQIYLPSDKQFCLFAYPKTKNSAIMVRSMEKRLRTVNIGKLKQTTAKDHAHGTQIK